MNEPYATIRCEFVFKCPRSWAFLTPTAEDGIRYCTTCERKVYLVTSHGELETHTKAGHCVAVPVVDAEDVPMTVGVTKAAPYHVLRSGDQGLPVIDDESEDR